VTTRHVSLAIATCTLAYGAAIANPEPAWRGVDLSYVNEMEDCGARYEAGGVRGDPFRILADAGANLVRLRLWHAPDWTDYGTLHDVKRSIRRAKDAGMRVLLDFHYSDDWADPGKQLRPPSWPAADDVDALAAQLGRYTTETLAELREASLLPDYVAVGNETNTEILLDGEVPEDTPIDWSRNAALLNAGIAAVRSLAPEPDNRPGVMLHIAQPENVEPWFDAAIAAGVTDFDLIGISYYPKWSSTPFTKLADALRHVRNKYGRDVVVVEAAYPWTLDAGDAAGNLLGEDSLVGGYPATADGQRRFLLDLMAAVRSAGGLGVVYWEPAWVSTGCRTRWGRGSHWENATLFDFDGRLLPGAEFLRP